MTKKTEIREVLDFSGFDLDKRVLLQVFALKSESEADKLRPAIAILAQERNCDNDLNDDMLIIAYKLDESKMNRFFFELRNTKQVLLNAFQMLSALDFKPAEKYDSLRSALFVLERQFYKNRSQYKVPLFLPPCLGTGVEITSLDDEVINVYLSNTDTFLKILSDAESEGIFDKKFYKHVRSAEEYCLHHNVKLKDFFQHPFLSNSGYITAPELTESKLEAYEKRNADMQFFKLDIGELNFMFYCILSKQSERVKETPNAQELRDFYTSNDDIARHARYLGLQCYFEIIFQLIVTFYVPHIIDRTYLIFALPKENKSAAHIERAISIAYARMRNTAAAIVNNRLGKLNGGYKQWL